MARKRQKLQKPAKYDELVKARSQILEAINLKPCYLTTIAQQGFSGLSREIGKLTLGRQIYEFLDYGNEEKWSKPLDQIMEDGDLELPQYSVLGRIDTGREVLGDLVNSLITMTGMNRNNLRLERYEHAGNMLLNMFMFLNEGQTENMKRGIIGNLCKSKIEEERQLGEKMIDLIKLARTVKYNKNGEIVKSPGGYVGNLMKAPAGVEVLYDSLTRDVAFMMIRRKRDGRIAEKLAYKIALAEEVLYDMLFNFTSFVKQAEQYQQYKNSKNPEERIKARRYKIYDEVHRAINRSRSPEKTNLKRAFDVFCKAYNEFIIDDFFGIKIAARTKEAATRIYNMISPLYATSYESIPNWKPPEGARLNSNIQGYYIVEIDNHSSQDRLSSLVQVILKKEAGTQMPGPDIYEIAIQTIRDISFDLYHPEIGHFRYENERKSAIEDMNPWIQQRFEAYSAYIEKMFKKVTSQNIFNL